MNRKFRYYIFDTLQGVILGTDNDENAEEFATSDDFFVVDTQTGEWMSIDGFREPVQEHT